jgi:transcriptional regulator with XRE-family HTH domain
MPDHQSFSRVNTQGNQLARALGRRLRYLRAQTGLTQLELARKASMDRAYISHLERGRILPRYVALVRLAGSLGVSVADLVRYAPCSSNTSNVVDTTRS